MTETRVCKNCQQDFTIEQEDFDFYKKIDVPAPTLCPDCRFQRRLAWFKAFRLYKRRCDLCLKEKISMYRPDAPYTVYCTDCWWSDKWDSAAFAQEYDFSRPFFEQFDDLLHKAPLLGLVIDKASIPTSPFNNYIGHAKNTYLTYYCDNNQDVAYGFFLSGNKSALDCVSEWESEQSYDNINGYKNFQVNGSFSNVHDSLDCSFVKDGQNLQHCFGSASIYSKKYVFFNEQLTKEEYEKRRAEIDLGSYATYQKMKIAAEQTWKNTIPRPYYDYFSENCTGNYAFHSKNSKECYQSGYCEDSKFVFLMKNPTTKDSYDYMDWGENALRVYECVTVGGNATDVRFSHDCGYGLSDVEYTNLAFSGNSNLFGCASVRNKQYCILNKQYSKEEYQALRAKIVAQMKQNGEYGEFFPMKLSPHDYNDTFAQLVFPITKEQALAQGLTWMESPSSEYQVTMNAGDLPDHIRDAQDSVLKEVIKCAECSRGYRITPDELGFLRQRNFPLPRRCPFCRIEEKVKKWVKQSVRLVDCTCDKCGAAFRTPYRKEDAAVVYCKKCYQAEFI